MFQVFQLFTNLNYYSKLVMGSGKDVARSFLILTAIVSLISGSVLAIQLRPKLLILLQTTVDQIVVELPKDLIVSWDKSQLQLLPKPSQPIEINWPKTFQSQALPRLLAVYSADQLFVPSDLINDQTKSTLFVINPTKLWISKLESNEWSEPIRLNEIPSLKGLPSQTLNRENLIEKFGQEQISFRHFIQLGLLLFPGLNIILNWWSGFWFCLIEASFIWAIGKIIHWSTKWSQVFKLSLVIVPVAQTMQILANWFYPSLTWSFFHLTYWLLFVLVSLRMPGLLSNQKQT